MRGTIPINRLRVLSMKLAVKPRLFSGEPFGVLYSGVNRSSKP
jgi:hypothetical protein